MSHADTSQHNDALPPDTPALRWFAYFICLMILLLIFFGGQVKSNDAGLAVPDWPMTFGENPITYHPSKWMGGIFHEHFHRLFAGFVALLSGIFAIVALLSQAPRWIKVLAWVNVVAVLVQAVLGGITVLYLLPTWASSSHAILAQTYLVLNVIMAYGLSREHRTRRQSVLENASPEPVTPVFTAALLLIAVLYCQLFFGALTRHTESALAIPDFPTMGGQYIPKFDDAMLQNINDWRFFNTDARGIPFEDVTKTQVMLHFMHRLGAVLVTLMVLLVGILAFRQESSNPKLFLTSAMIIAVTFAQFMLGIMVVLTLRVPFVTSLHVAGGALLLALATLLALRARPMHPRREPAPIAAPQTTASATS